MRIGYIIIFLIAGVSLCLFAGPLNERGAAAGLTVATAEISPESPPSAPARPVAEGALRVVHPCEGARLPFLPSTFMFGSADPRGKLTVNGQPVPIHPGGGFITMVGLSTGTCLINAELIVDSTSYTVTRAITVDRPSVPSPVSPLTVEHLLPDADAEIVPGEEVVVSCKGSPGMKASFTIDRIRRTFSLVESPPASGLYRGVYVADAGDNLKRSRVRATLTDRKSGKQKTGASDGTLSFFRNSAPVVAEITAERAILRSCPAFSPGDSAAYLLFLPKGTQVRLTGRRGNEMRVRLTGTREAWITHSDMKTLPEGTPPPRVTVPSIRVIGHGRTTEVRFPLGRRVPFEVIPDDEGNAIDVRLFGAVSNTDIVIYPSSGSAVEQVRWFQDDSETYRLHVRPYPGRWWGYDARYEGNVFVFELRSPPEALRGASPLEGITVAVDPGHSPDTGAVGPTGLMEKDANLELALCLRKKLIAEGANVVMTRTGAEGVALYDRPKIAWRENADLLISMHNNALPDGENPFERNGYGVYYYHPASRALAKEIHSAYGGLFGPDNPSGAVLRDDGLYYDNLAIPRTTQMPSVLIESAYIIIPQEEACLKTSAFRERCADAVTAGIKRYVNTVCRREPLPQKKRK